MRRPDHHHAGQQGKGRRRERYQILGHRPGHQDAIVRIDHVSGRHHGIGLGGDHVGALAGRRLDNTHHTIEVGFAVSSDRQILEMPPIGQPLRQAVAPVFLVRVQIGQIHRLATGCRHHHDRRGVGRRVNDFIELVPRATLGIARCHHGQGRAAIDRRPPNAALGKIPDLTAVRRPEHIGGRFGAVQTAKPALGQMPDHDATAAGGIHPRKTQVLPIRRDLHRARFGRLQIQRHALVQVDRRLKKGPGFGTRPHQANHSGHQGPDRHHGQCAGGKPRQAGTLCRPTCSRRHAETTGRQPNDRRPTAFQRHPHFADIPQPLLGILLQAAPANLQQQGRMLAFELIPGRLLVQNRRQGIGGRLAFEQPITGEHLVEDHAKGPDVAAPVHLVTAGLLRAHVGRRTQHRARPGQGLSNSRLVGMGFRFALGHAVGGEGPGQTKIENLDRTFARNLHIGRLQIAVHDALLVGVFQPSRQLAGDLVDLVFGQRPPLQTHAQVFTGRQFHGQHRLPLGSFQPITGRDILVLQ